MCSYPVAVVYHDTMEPAMLRGDVMLLSKWNPIENGDIVLYRLSGDTSFYPTNIARVTAK